MSVLSPPSEAAPAADALVAGPAGRLAVRARGAVPGARSAVVLVQGALLSGQTAYDIPAEALPEGAADVALLPVLSAAGHAAVTFAIRGYGESELTGDPLAMSTEDAMADLGAVVAWVRERTGLERVSLFGWSWGGRIAARFAGDHPDLVERLVLMDPALGGNQPHPELVPTEPYKELSVEEYRRRVEPDHTDPAINEAVAQYAAAVDRRAPFGIGREGALGPSPADPTRITCPTLMVYGAAAARAEYMQGAETREAFFGRLSTDERVFAIVPDGGDYLQFQRGRHAFQRHLADFLAPALVGGAA